MFLTIAAPNPARVSERNTQKPCPEKPEREIAPNTVPSPMGGNEAISTMIGAARYHIQPAFKLSASPKSFQPSPPNVRRSTFAKSGEINQISAPKPCMG